MTGLRRTSMNGQVPLNASLQFPTTFVKRTTIEFLQTLFATRPDGDLKYSDEDSETGIWISSSYPAGLEAFHVRPAIIGLRGPISYQQVGLGGNAVEGIERRTGEIMHNDLLMASMSFSCYSKEEEEADAIASLVLGAFKHFGPELKKHGFFTVKSLNMGNCAAVAQEGGQNDLYMTPVFVTTQFQDRALLINDTKRKLRDIIVEVTT